MAKKVEENKKFPCECGKSFGTAEQFSDHVHTDCEKGLVSWKPTTDYLAGRAAAK